MLEQIDMLAIVAIVMLLAAVLLIRLLLRQTPKARMNVAPSHENKLNELSFDLVESSLERARTDLTPWSHFLGSRNTPQILAKKGKSLAPVLLTYSLEATKSIKEMRGLTTAGFDLRLKEGSCLTEILLFSLVWLDIKASRLLAHEDRKILFEALFTEIADILQLPVADRFEELLAEQAVEYGGLLLKGAGEEDALFSEIGRRLSAILAPQRHSIYQRDKAPAPADEETFDSFMKNSIHAIDFDQLLSDKPVS